LQKYHYLRSINQMAMNRICELFGIKYPIVAGGMVWCSGWRLASAVSNAGGLGLIGAGSMQPLLAAGGIASGEAIAAAMALGADGVQMGTRFALTVESSASDAFKQRCLNLNEGDTQLTMKQISPTRMIKNDFFQLIDNAEKSGAIIDELREIIGKGRTKKGIFEGELDDGELEIGQIASSIKQIRTVSEAMVQMIDEYNAVIRRLGTASL
jgi:NAD(P)H-dependent flavin oxidoreductase YrpB (nitropropane dioxygenase family)